ncbi:MAG TPA: hypothetical protein VNN20_06385 [Thermodesulfobacteriota bacterium]|nr:hypothetical protein [Thermodesulfobacteriota bacterium]
MVEIEEVLKEIKKIYKRLYKIDSDILTLRGIARPQTPPTEEEEEMPTWLLPEADHKPDELVKVYLPELNLEYQINGTYHNHKETMAWVATAFYLPTVIVFGYKAGEILHSCHSKLLLPVFLSFIFILGFIFVNMQLRKRWDAANRITIIQQFRNLLISSPEKYKNKIKEYKEKYEKKIKNCEKKFKELPIVIQQIRNSEYRKKIEEYKDKIKKYENKDATLIELIDEEAAFNMQKRRNAIKCFFLLQKFDDRLKTELVTYLVLIIGTVIAFYLAFVMANSQVVAISEDKYDELKTIIQSIKVSIQQLPLDPDQKSELESQLITVETQLSSPKPKFIIINESVNSIRRILEGVSRIELARTLLRQIEFLRQK